MRSQFENEPKKRTFKFIFFQHRWQITNFNNVKQPGLTNFSTTNMFRRVSHRNTSPVVLNTSIAVWRECRLNLKPVQKRTQEMLISGSGDWVQAIPPDSSVYVLSNNKSCDQGPTLRVCIPPPRWAPPQQGADDSPTPGHRSLGESADCPGSSTSHPSLDRGPTSSSTGLNWCLMVSMGAF